MCWCQTATFGLVYLGWRPAALYGQGHSAILAQRLHGLPDYITRLGQLDGRYGEVG